MEFLEPFYYDDFKCIGDKCIDNCCHGWSIYIDKKSYLKYRKVRGEFGKKLNEIIARNKKNPSDINYGEFKLNDRKCPLLNDKGLCELFIHEGEKSLCDTCTYYPRTCTVYTKNNTNINDNYVEKNLHLSCPEVARKLVKHKDKFGFVFKDKTDKKLFVNNCVQNYDEKLYDMLWESRSFAIDIVQLSDLPLYKRLILLMFLEGRLQKLIDSNNISDYKNVLNEFANQIGAFAATNEISEVNNLIKIQLISNIVMLKDGMKDMVNILSILLNFIDGKTIEEAKEELSKEEKKFNQYIKDKEYIFENYMVYLLYENFMKALRSKDLHKEMIHIMIEYACTKLLLMSKWIENGEELSEDDFVKVMYLVSRFLEHSVGLISQIHKWIIENKIDTPAYLTTLIY